MYDEELKALEDQLQGAINGIERAPTAEQRQDRHNRAQELLKRVQKAHHQLRMEVRLLDGDTEALYAKKASDHAAVIQKLKESLNTKRAEANSGDANNNNNGAAAAGGTRTSTAPMGTERRNDGKDEARATAGRIATTQKSTIQSLNETERLIDETETIGNDAANTLRKQTDDIRKINENLDQLDSDVNRAKKELNAFIRRMMTDKIILCFAVLVVVAIIVIVVMKIKNSDSGSSPAPAQHNTSAMVYEISNLMRQRN